jgi:hypothetical protein
MYRGLRLDGGECFLRLSIPFNAFRLRLPRLARLRRLVLNRLSRFRGCIGLVLRFGIGWNFITSTTSSPEPNGLRQYRLACLIVRGIAVLSSVFATRRGSFAARRAIVVRLQKDTPELTLHVHPFFSAIFMMKGRPDFRQRRTLTVSAYGDARNIFVNIEAYTRPVLRSDVCLHTFRRRLLRPGLRVCPRIVGLPGLFFMYIVRWRCYLEIGIRHTGPGIIAIQGQRFVPPIVEQLSEKVFSRHLYVLVRKCTLICADTRRSTSPAALGRRDLISFPAPSCPTKSAISARSPRR